MSWYTDNRLILDTDCLVEAHCLDGNAEFDGVYGIMYIIKVHETFKELMVMYTERESRDKAFLALGFIITGNQK